MTGQGDDLKTRGGFCQKGQQPRQAAGVGGRQDIIGYHHLAFRFGKHLGQGQSRGELQLPLLPARQVADIYGRFCQIRRYPGWLKSLSDFNSSDAGAGNAVQNSGSGFFDGLRYRGHRFGSALFDSIIKELDGIHPECFAPDFLIYPRQLFANGANVFNTSADEDCTIGKSRSGTNYSTGICFLLWGHRYLRGSHGAETLPICRETARAA